MGHGAPKNITGSIPDNLIASAFAASGLVHETLTFLNHNLRLAKSDPENPDVWLAIEENRSRLSAYSGQLQSAIRRIQMHMDKG